MKETPMEQESETTSEDIERSMHENYTIPRETPNEQGISHKSHTKFDKTLIGIALPKVVSRSTFLLENRQAILNIYMKLKKSYIPNNLRPSMIQEKHTYKQ